MTNAPIIAANAFSLTPFGSDALTFAGEDSGPAPSAFESSSSPSVAGISNANLLLAAVI